MRYGSEDAAMDGRRKAGEPHPDWRKNYDFIVDQLKRDVIQKKIANAQASQRWTGVQQISTIEVDEPGFPGMKRQEPVWEVLTAFVLEWTHFHQKCSHPFSLHQDSEKLVEEWNKFFKLDSDYSTKKYGW